MASIRNPNRRKTASFSSSLLDSIYRSIDNDGQDDHLQGSKQRYEATCVEEEIMNLRRAIMIEKRTENRKLRGIAAASSSSDSSSAGPFSSSENDSFYSNTRNRERARSVSSCFTPRRPNPNPSGSDSCKANRFYENQITGYGELRAKNLGDSPISPGRRISNFLNSLFTAKREKENQQHNSNNYNHNCNYSCDYSKINYNYDYNYKSTSLISSPRTSKRRSPSLIVHDQRSTATYPVNVVGENKTNIKDSSSMKAKIREGNMYSRANNAFQFRKEVDDDDDAWSHASSDLFELADHIIGIGKYSQELPVYETTSLKKNHAIAKGSVNWN